MDDYKLFTSMWWWQVFLNHMYYCKKKYFDKEEMERDIEMTHFIMDRTRKAMKREILEEIVNESKLNLN